MTKRQTGPRFGTSNIDTPPEIGAVMAGVLPPGTVFVEPMAGCGMLRDALVADGHICGYAGDIEPRGDGIEERCATTLNAAFWAEHWDVSHVVSNIPFQWAMARPIVDAIITWPVPSLILCPNDWITHARFRPYMPFVHGMLPLGRIRWVPGSAHKSTDAYCALLFKAEPAQDSFFLGAQS